MKNFKINSALIERLKREAELAEKNNYITRREFLNRMAFISSLAIGVPLLLQEKASAHFFKMAFWQKKAVVPSSDPYFGYVKSLCNYTSGSADVVGNIVNLYGDAAVSGGKLVIDPDSDYQKITGSHGGLIRIGTNDFVIECFIDFSLALSDASVYYPYIFTTSGDGLNDGLILYVEISWPVGSKLRLIYGGGSELLTADERLFTAGQTHHLALARTGTLVELYLNGTRIANATSAYDSSYDRLTWGGNDVSPGSNRIPARNYYATRLTVGSNRGYTGTTITVPTDPFPETGTITDPYFSFVKFLSNYTSGYSDVKGHTVTLFGDATVSNGALVLDGTDDYLAVAASSDFSLGVSEAFVLECFSTLTIDDGNWRSMLQVWQENQSSDGLYELQWSSSGYGNELLASIDSVIVRNGGGVVATKAGSLNLKVHTAFVRDGTGALSLYLDGVRVATGTSTRAITSPIMTIGKNSWASPQFQGKIHGARLTIGTTRGYTGASISVPLDPFPETGSNYVDVITTDAPIGFWRLNDGAAANGNTATATIGTNGTYRVGCSVGGEGQIPAGGSVLFDQTASGGAQGMLTNVYTDFTTACTLECLFHTSGAQTDTVGYVITKNYFYATTTASFPMALARSNTGPISLTLSSGNDFNGDTTLQTNISDSTWYHVAAVYRASGLCELYLNGVLADSATIGYSINAFSSGGWTVGSAFGWNGGGSDLGTFNGKIAEVAIYNKALTSAEILNHAKVAGLA